MLILELDYDIFGYIITFLPYKTLVNFLTTCTQISSIIEIQLIYNWCLQEKETYTHNRICKTLKKSQDTDTKSVVFYIRYQLYDKVLERKYDKIYSKIFLERICHSKKYVEYIAEKHLTYENKIKYLKKCVRTNSTNSTNSDNALSWNFSLSQKFLEFSQISEEIKFDTEYSFCYMFLETFSKYQKWLKNRIRIVESQLFSIKTLIS